jgi:COX assembly protein 1
MPRKPIYQELNQIARKKCDDDIKAFAKCAEVNGLMVVFRCREHNNAMNNCLHQYTNEAAFDAFRRAKINEGTA